MAHVMDPKTAELGANELRSVLRDYGVDSCDILPAQDRVVIHLPLDDVFRFMVEAKATRASSTRKAPRERFPSDEWEPSPLN